MARVMDGMFEDASEFNQDLSMWCVVNVQSYLGFAQGSSMSERDIPYFGMESNCSRKLGEPFYLHSNGVTILCPEAPPGTWGFVDGIKYIRPTDDELSAMKGTRVASLRRTTICTSGIQDMSGWFAATGPREYDNITSLDTSMVTDMSSMFSSNEEFNQPIGSWNTSQVTSMTRMFERGYFNQPIGDWDTSNVRDMSSMF